MVRAFLLLLFVICLAGCRQPAQRGREDVSVTFEADSLVRGNTVLTVTLADAAGRPLTADRLDVRGDMTHAGMVPVLAEAGEGVDGVYRVPFEWTMDGDWIVTVTATFSDGTTAEQRFDLSIGD